MRIYGDFLALGLHALRRFSRSPLPQVLTLARATAQKCCVSATCQYATRVCAYHLQAVAICNENSTLRPTQTRRCTLASRPYSSSNGGRWESSENESAEGAGGANQQPPRPPVAARLSPTQGAAEKGHEEWNEEGVEEAGYEHDGNEGEEGDEEDIWEQYREVDVENDDDRDDLDPKIPEKRYALPKEIRAEAAEAAELPFPGEEEEDFEGKRRQALEQPSHGRPSKRDLYEQHLNAQAEKISGFFKTLDSKLDMSRREREEKIREAGLREDMQIPGVPSPLLTAVPQGLRQLEALTESEEWCMTIVNVKMTTNQTAQGKKSRYSAMVMVGNLAGKGGYGTGASKNSKTAILKALRFAILGAINIPLYRRHTVYFPTKTKYVTTKISIFPRPTDFGISASPIVTEACELLGIKNITVKCADCIGISASPVITKACELLGIQSTIVKTHQSRNIRNVVKGLFQALANIPTAAEVAQVKGVYMREVLPTRISPKPI